MIRMFMILIGTICLFTCDDGYLNKTAHIKGTARIYFESEKYSKFNGNIEKVTLFDINLLPIQEVKYNSRKNDNPKISMELFFYDSSQSLVRSEDSYLPDHHNKSVIIYDKYGNDLVWIGFKGERQITPSMYYENEYDSNNRLIQRHWKSLRRLS